ncbi:phasin family protein [Cohnella herbarum]|uniref:Polyhydroxyalkanoate synthesis regulator phasin n=1 Tax=Cohnella herbarum TaxID=2728023 RepID=A0A7Z2VHK7_9BACL|nr:hypothetical protein [Cohnella herbarum]QJD83055.1 hypothetical protein HH215_07640 [Cohnella herbarum]
MRDTIEKAFSLGLGLAVAGKEQIEKTIDELVKKGEMSKTESRTLVNDLVGKGEEMRKRIEVVVKERVQAIVGDGRLATKEDIERIEQRLTILEQREPTAT